LKKGDVFKLILTLTGEGNLHNTIRPEIKLPNGFVLYGDPEKDEQIEFSEKGATGKLTYTYHIQIKQAVSTHFPSQKISYFDPEKKKYITLSKPGQDLNVSIENVAQTTTQNKPTSPLEKTEKTSLFLESSKGETNSTSPVVLWSVLIGSLGLATVGGLYGKKITGVVSIPVLNQTKTVSTAFTFYKTINFQTIPISEGYKQLEESIKLLGSQFLGENEVCNSKLEVCSILAKKHIPSEHIQHIQEVLTSCEEARYSFTENREHLLSCAKKLEQTLTALS
jgi:hypothetical protein